MLDTHLNQLCYNEIRVEKRKMGELRSNGIYKYIYSSLGTCRKVQTYLLAQMRVTTKVPGLLPLAQAETYYETPVKMLLCLHWRSEKLKL